MLREDNCFIGTTRFERTAGVAFDCQIQYGGICDKMMWGASDPFVRFWSDGLSGTLHRWSARGKVLGCGSNTEELYAILAAAHLSPREIELQVFRNPTDDRCKIRGSCAGIELQKRYNDHLSDCETPLRKIRSANARASRTRTKYVNDLNTESESLKMINWFVPEV